MELIVHVAQKYLSQFWAVWGGMIVAMMVRKLVKVSFNIILAIIFAGIVISILTAAGILPPLTEIFSSIFALFSP